MAETRTKKARPGARPRITIDRAYADRLDSLANSSQNRRPELAERLFEELDRARFVDSAKMPKNIVSIGNAVTYRDETTGREQMAILVFPGEADIENGRVSVLTPIGVALLGLPEGASFWWETRQGERRQLTVTHVGPAPEPEEPAEESAAETERPAIGADRIDETLSASFPASDPPPWTLGRS